MRFTVASFRHSVLIAASLLFPLSLLAQTAQQAGPWLEGLGIRNVGPAGMSGRVTSIDAVRNNPAVIYIGTASGGLWKSTSGGVEWEPLFDRQAVQSIGAVRIDPNNASVIWAGTGEGNPRNSHNSGGGIYRSPDGGRSWQMRGLEDTRTIHRIIVDPRDGDVVFAAAPGSAWGPNPERGVYRTKNAGRDWEQVLSVNDSTGCADLIMDPSNPDKLFAAMWEFGRKPWFFTSGGKGSGIYMTLDGGDTWRLVNRKGSGLPEGDLGRVGLAIAPSDPNIVYALVEAKENALYRSTDGGFTWKKRATEGIGNRPFYYAEIHVDPHNENRLYSLFSMVSRSEDGGKSWEVIIPYSGVHPDHHAWYIHPDNPDLLMNGNDGGFNISHDRGGSWRFAENLPLAQFYHIAVDREKPYHIYGGMQDNGSWVGPAYAWQRGGIRNENWHEVLFGDGFDVQPYPANPRYGYAMWQGGNLAEYDVETGSTKRLVPVHPDGIPLRFNWNAALALDPFDSDGLYFGSQFLHHSTDRGRTWKLLSDDLTTNDSSRQKQAESGGLTIDATNAENFTALLAIAPSPLDRGVIWTGSDDGLLHVTRNGGETWTPCSGRLPGAPKGAWIPQIVASTHQAGEAFVILNDYRRNNWEPYAYHTTDFGSTWRRIAGPDKVNGFCLSIVQDVEEPNLLFLGGDRGLWFSLDKGNSWEKWSRDFPAVNVTDLVIHPVEGDLVAGTFGRAAWVLDDLTPLRRLAAEKETLLRESLVLFDAPAGIQASWRQPPGVRFDADAGFRGSNRPGGLRLTFWLSPEAFTPVAEDAMEGAGNKDKKSKKQKDRSAATENEMNADASDSSKTPKPKKAADKIQVMVFDAAGDTVRQFKVPADTGFVRTTWDMRTKGEEWPSREKRKKDADQRAGRPAMPGNYGMLATWKDAKGTEHRDSIVVEVLADPRQETPSMADRAAYNAAYDRWEKQINAISRGTTRLRLWREALDRMDGNLSRLPDSLRKPLRDQEKVLKDSLLALEAIVMTPKKFKGIDGEQRLTNYLWRAGSYLESDEAPSASAQLALSANEARIRVFLDRLNAFQAGAWKSYREAVENAAWSPFPEDAPLNWE